MKWSTLAVLALSAVMFVGCKHTQLPANCPPAKPVVVEKIVPVPDSSLVRVTAWITNQHRQKPTTLNGLGPQSSTAEIGKAALLEVAWWRTFYRDITGLLTGPKDNNGNIITVQ